MEENTIHPELQNIYSFEFNSSPGHDLFSDDDDSEEEGEDGYIEIDLEPLLTDTHVEGEEEKSSDDDKELEYFPVSFSWRTSLPSQDFSSSTTTTSASSAATSFVCPIDTPVSQQAASELPQLRADITRDSWKLVQSRKASTRVVTTAMNNRVAKLLVKFKSNIKHFKSMIASLTTKPGQVISPGGNREENINKKTESVSVWNFERVIKPFERWSVQRKGGDQSTNTKQPYRNGSEINLDAVRGFILEAINNIGRSKGKIRKSSPISTESSPNQNKVFARDNSVQAAIAHCKRSFDQTPHFNS